MKKAILSAIVLFFSVVYAFSQNAGNAAPVSVAVTSSPAAPVTSGTSPAPAPANTASASTPPPSTKPAPAPAPAPAPVPAPKPKGLYADGTYTGSVADAYYGYVQVEVNVSGGKISNVTFLQYPSDRSTSRYINSQAMPYLTQEALAAQSANVNIVSGATDTSMAFQQSLADALAKAKNA
ncbi:MAG: FMN-binding protein [Patescibacteria group bacterium]|nr:FMN-binding protein [Patescibacteria group bacterium]MDE1965672.1 FMN-binding protein [Patescibacteria group bacterium]